MSATATAIAVNLEAICDHTSCMDFATTMRTKLNTPKYTRGVSLMPVPGTLEEWRQEHRTARKRADRASRLGYRFDTIRREAHNLSIHEINVSLPERQGRPMSAGYTTPQAHRPLPDYPCDRHRIHTYGVLQEDVLRAYLTLYRVGDLALISMILGHGGYLRDDVMWLLFAGLVAEQAGRGGWFYYNRHDSGTDGLRYYKERVGFQPADVEWVLQ